MTKPPPTNANLYALFSSRFANAPNRPFLRVPGGEALTYGQVDDRSARMAGVLSEAGLSEGDRLVAQVEKSIDNVVLYLAVLRSGAVYVPLNPAYTAAEMAYFVEDADPALVVCDPSSESVELADFTLDAHGGGSLAEASKSAPPVSTIAVRSEQDLAAMIYTSGTTGRSKGAMLTHGNLSSNALALHEAWAFEPGDVVLHCLPIYHVHGLMVALHTAMLNVSEVIFLPRFAVDPILSELVHATVMMGVPTYYTRLLADPRFGGGTCTGVRLFTSGSAPMTGAVHAEFTERTGHQILERYGMSEAGMITSNPYSGERVPGTVGFALPGVEVRVCDDQGRTLAAGLSGMVEVRGPNLFVGYWGQPEKTAEAMRPDGFFITGDVGHLDGEGRLSLEGRAGDMIITGGLNVYPKEIEMVLDGGDGVLESAVVGLPHADLGEAVTAFLVPQPTKTIEAEVLAAALAGRLASFKRPKEFVVIDELPRNTMGKVQKSVLRERYAGLYEA